MTKKRKDTEIVLDNYLVNQKLRTSVVEFITKLVEREDLKVPIHSRKGAKKA